MDYSMMTLFFMVLIGSFSLNDAEDQCPPLAGANRLSAPTKMTNNKSVCGKMFGNNSCCSGETADNIQAGKNHFNNFIQRVISFQSAGQNNECENLFERLACLIECSPNFKNMSSPKEIPLCKNTCELLYNACSAVLTCSGDWGKAMKNETFDCNKLVNDIPIYDHENLHFKVKSPEDFCKALLESQFFNVTDSNFDCFDLKTGKYVRSSDPGMSYHIFSYIGMAVIVMVMWAGIVYAIRYAMKRNHPMQGL